MSRCRPRWQKTLVVVELLLILGWVYLLFQLQPEVAAIQAPAATADAATVHQLRQGIAEQLAIRRVVLPALQTDSALPAPPAELPFEVAAPSGEAAGENAVPEVGVYSPLGEPHAPAASGPAETRQSRLAATPPCPYTVTTIIAGNGKPIAVLVDSTTGQSRFVSVGETVGGWTVTAINNGEVALQSGATSRALRLQ